MEICYFTDLRTRQAFRVVKAWHSGRLYVELLTPAAYPTGPQHWEPTHEADLGCFGAVDCPRFLALVATGAVAQGCARFYSLAS